MHSFTATASVLERSDPRWLAFLHGRTLTAYQSPRWAEALTNGYGIPVRILGILEEDAVVGGIPFADVDDFRGRRRIALPFSDSCEPVAVSLEALEPVLCADEIPWQLRTRAGPGSRARGAEMIATHLFATLPPSAAEVERQLHVKHKQNVKQAENAGLRYERRSIEDGLEPFYELYTAVRREKHHRLPQGRKVFEALHDAFGSDGFIALALSGGRAVAAMLFLIESNTLYYAFSASAGDALLVRPNHFLMTRAMEDAAERGIGGIDLGMSPHEGLIRFKQRVGGVPSPVYRIDYGTFVKTPEMEQLEQRLRNLTLLMTRPEVPASAAQEAGSLFYRYFL
jgi:CelD/BcsL family acetyltransferase involved in cellulose biosynthesis